MKEEQKNDGLLAHIRKETMLGPDEKFDPNNPRHIDRLYEAMNKVPYYRQPFYISLEMEKKLNETYAKMKNQNGTI